MPVALGMDHPLASSVDDSRNTPKPTHAGEPPTKVRARRDPTKVRTSYNKESALPLPANLLDCIFDPGARARVMSCTAEWYLSDWSLQSDRLPKRRKEV